MNNFAKRIKGAEYKLDPQVTSIAIIALALRRTVLLIRGLTYTQGL